MIAKVGSSSVVSRWPFGFQHILYFAALFVSCSVSIRAQGTPKFHPPEKFAISCRPLEITQAANPKRAFTVTGERAGIFGHQDGSFEQWVFPIKVIDRFEIEARVDGLDAPIRMNSQATQVEVCPDHTTITYSNAAIVIKQHMFAIRRNSAAKIGAVVMFEIEAARSAVITFRFVPIMVPEWPAPATGAPKASWVSVGDGGGYLLTTSSPSLFGIVAMPGTGRPAAPVGEPEESALHFQLQFDPQRDSNLFFPLLMAASYRDSSSINQITENLARDIADANDEISELYATTRDYYARFFQHKMTIDTPDARINEAFRWAELSIDQMRLNLGTETGLAAGWASSGALARPGFGWFFGRDTLWSLFAIDSYGDFALARDALAFLIARQRSDGKIMHEFSQTSNEVDWAATPYFYASADSTPLFLMAMADYLRSSADLEFLRVNWASVKRAYAFIQDHLNGDGLYDNSQGTGWVEDWPPPLPHQEVYLVALEQQADEAMSQLARWMGDAQLASSAGARADFVCEKLADYRQPDGLYAFSKNTDGSYDDTPTIFPSVAWWTGHLSLPEADGMLQQWNSSQFATDWGVRSISSASKIYDSLSYHHGSVWPLFTGWVSMAQYKSNRPLAGYEQLISNLNLTWSQDPGAITELLSGQFDEPLDQSTWHQLWSSAMVVSPLIRGMFGMEADATNGYLTLKPQLPASWEHATIHDVPFGDGELELTMRRVGSHLAIDAVSSDKLALCLVLATDAPRSENSARPKCTQAKSIHHRMRMLLPAVEVAESMEQPSPGSATQHMKVVDERYSSRQLSLELEAPAGTTQYLLLRFDGIRRKLTVSGAVRDGDTLRISFPSGNGYESQKIQISW